MSGIRIGVNALYLIPGGVGGSEIYLRELLQALARVDSSNRYVVFTNRETGADLVPAAPNFQRVEAPVRGTIRPARILWEQIFLPASIRRHRLDVLFSPGFTTPRCCGRPAVTVFHDLQHKRFPEHFRWFDLPFWNLFLGQSAASSRALIAISQATADDLEHYYPGSRAKTSVVHHGVEEAFRAIRSERRPETFLLCVSTLHPHKNLERLVRAFAQLRRRHPEFSLTLAGMRGFHARSVERLVGDLDLGDAVRMTGWIRREELYDLYRRAWAFVYPSTFEGFGMPVLEALAAGLPTACSGIAPLREVAGGAALFFDPGDEGGLVETLETLVSDELERARLAKKGPERAAGFSWEKTAAATLDVIRGAVVLG